MMVTASADGSMLTPALLLKYKRIPAKVRKLKINVEISGFYLCFFISTPIFRLTSPVLKTGSISSLSRAG